MNTSDNVKLVKCSVSSKFASDLQDLYLIWSLEKMENGEDFSCEDWEDFIIYCVKGGVYSE